MNNSSQWPRSDGEQVRRTGSRAALPPDALKRCPSCGRPRGNTRKKWFPITRAGEVVGYTCADCPTWDEPIRRQTTPGGAIRFVAVVGVIEQGKRRQLKRTFGALDVARSWVEKTKSASKAGHRTRTGKHTDPSRLTLQALCDSWIEARRSEVGTPGGIREVSVNGYASSLHSALHHAGDRIARDLTTDDIEALMRKLITVGGKRGRPLSHRSAMYALGTLRQVFAWGVRVDLLVRNPAEDAKPPRKVRGTSQPSRVLRWSPAQLAQFRRHSDTYGDGERFAAEPWARVGARLTLSGLRRSEVLGLDWRWVDLENGTVQVAPEGSSRVKTGRSNTTEVGDAKTERSARVVAVEEIHPGSSAALRLLWDAQRRPSAGLVILDATGLPVHPDKYSRVFRRLCREAGVPVLARMHNVRHTIATALQAAGVPDHAAAAMLGHDVDTYRRFYLVTDEEAAAVAASVAGKLFADPETEQVTTAVTNGSAQDETSGDQQTQE